MSWMSNKTTNTTKPPYYRIFIREGTKNYLFCRIWQQKSDVSLMLQLNSKKGGTGDTLGKIKIMSNPFDIRYDDVSQPVEIEHTSIHATGQSHTKMKDGSRTVNNDKNAISIPLKGLSTSKHLSTLLCREMVEGDLRETLRENDVPIERKPKQRFTTLDLIAIPKSQNINFNVNWEMENDRPVELSVVLHRLSFKSFDVIIFTRHSDQFDVVPPKTIQLPDMNDKVPFVTKIDEEKLTVNISNLTFSQMVKPAGNDPYDGYTVLRATSKYL